MRNLPATSSLTHLWSSQKERKLGADQKPEIIAVIGLGYVGLPLAVAFAHHFSVIGFDKDTSRIAELRACHDRNHEVTDADLAAATGLNLTSDTSDLSQATVHVIAVPTPLNDARVPDITMLLEATQRVAGALRQGGLVIYESSVYPGATEEDCIPILEQISGLRLHRDFSVVYSPERINPGDKVNRLDTISKVVSATDPAACERAAAIYAQIVEADLYLAPTIKVAEMSKIFENTQRDINIALMNELAQICHRLDIDTGDVLEAARTKWNFVHFKPGLVGGHCIGIDPYYLKHRAERTGFHPAMIHAGRRLNDGLGRWIATEVMRILSRSHVVDPKVTILGITYKENVNDTRNTRVVDMVHELQSFGVDVQVADAFARSDHVADEHGIVITDEADLVPADALILAVAHDTYVRRGWDMVRPLLRGHTPVVADVRCVLDRSRRPEHVQLWRL